jgi:hypothetical protein
MAIASRLRQRRQPITITVKVKALAGGQHSESNALTGLTATREQVDAVEVATAGGAFVPVTDVFWFEESSGSLPAIEEKHVLVDGSSVRYEVIQVADQGGEGNRLKVMTKRLR